MNMELNSRLIFLPTDIDHNKPITWYFIHECLFRSWKGMHKTQCIYFSEPPRLKLQWSYLKGVYGIITHASVWSAIFKIWRESKYRSLKMCDCLYVTVRTQVQQSYVSVHSLLRYGLHTHFEPDLTRENKIASALSKTPAIFTTV